MTQKRTPSEPGEPRGLTRIAGSILRLHRTKIGFTQQEAAETLGCSKDMWSRAERGISRLRFFRVHIGPITTKLNVDADGLLLLLNGLWIDELLAAVRAAAKSRDAYRSSAAFPMLQWLWYDANARMWLKLLLMKDPSPWLDEWEDLALVPCLARHPALKHFVRRNLRRTDAPRSPKGGAARETLWDALRLTLLIDDSSLHMLRQAVFGAQRNAIDALRQPPGDLPALGDMLLLFADVATSDEAAKDYLRNALRSVGDDLHAIDRRYCARALYLLGDLRPLCAVVESTYEAPDPSVLRYYRERSGGTDRDGTQTLADLCSKLEFAYSRLNIHLLALYLGTTLQLVRRRPTESGWSLALGNFSTSNRLAALLDRVTKWFEKITSSRQRRPVRQHCCDVSPDCLCRARTAAEEIQAAIVRARAALRAADEQRLRAGGTASAGAAAATTLRVDRPKRRIQRPE